MRHTKPMLGHLPQGTKVMVSSHERMRFLQGEAERLGRSDLMFMRVGHEGTAMHGRTVDGFYIDEPSEELK